MTATDTPVTLSYRVQRTITIDIDVTPDDARYAAAAGETLAEYAAALAEHMPPGMWELIDETVSPA